MRVLVCHSCAGKRNGERIIFENALIRHLQRRHNRYNMAVRILTHNLHRVINETAVIDGGFAVCFE